MDDKGSGKNYKLKITMKDVKCYCNTKLLSTQPGI